MSAAMTDAAPRAADTRAPMAALILGGMVSQAVSSAVELRAPEELASGPRRSEELAARCGADGWDLERLLQAPASVGLCARTTDKRVCACAARRDVARPRGRRTSLAGMARFVGSGWLAAARAAMTESIRTGVSAFRCAHGADLYECMQDHPDLAALYDGWAGYSSGVDRRRSRCWRAMTSRARDTWSTWAGAASSAHLDTGNSGVRTSTHSSGSNQLDRSGTSSRGS
jgi:hypothetical protein